MEGSECSVQSCAVMWRGVFNSIDSVHSTRFQQFCVILMSQKLDYGEIPTKFFDVNTEHRVFFVFIIIIRHSLYFVCADVIFKILNIIQKALKELCKKYGLKRAIYTL